MSSINYNKQQQQQQQHKHNSNNSSKKVAAIDVIAVEGRTVSLPCNVTPPGHDKVYMVFWFQDDAGIPLYSFDVRGKPLKEARHWSAPEVFGSRAYFKTSNSNNDGDNNNDHNTHNTDVAQLVINDIKRHDEGVYRCRVDFRNTQTRSFRYNLTVIVPPNEPQILDRWGRQLTNKTLGPLDVGDDIILTCRVIGGKPEPIVRWLLNGIIIDSEYEHNIGDVIENRLTWPSIQRSDFKSIFTCQTLNTKLTQPKESYIILDLYLSPLTVNIIKPIEPTYLVADRRYEVQCESTGSRPPAIITWYKGKRQLKRTKEDIKENKTISELSFVPTTEDDNKPITCRAENPNVTGLYLESTWNINVVYPPIVSLRLGSTLQSDDIKEGDDVYFECHVKSNPPWRKLQWLHNNNIINHNMSARIIRSNQSLVLQRVTKHSAGKYQCSAINSEGETVSNALIFRVKYAPICRNDRIIVIGASRSESLNINCEIDSDPQVYKYKWKFNNSGETIDINMERYINKSNGTNSILEYTPITDLDYGTLSCWAINSIGQQLLPCVFQIVAAGKPYSVRNCTLLNQTLNSMNVQCLSGFDGGLPQYFLLELYTTTQLQTTLSTTTLIKTNNYNNNNNIINKHKYGYLIYNQTNQYEPEFLLTNLQSDVIYHIIIYAINSKGYSQPFIIDNIQFIDYDKHTVLTNDLLPISTTIIGVFIGITFTLIIITFYIIIKIRKSKDTTQSCLLAIQQQQHQQQQQHFINNNTNNRCEQQQQQQLIITPTTTIILTTTATVTTTTTAASATATTMAAEKSNNSNMLIMLQSQQQQQQYNTSSYEQQQQHEPDPDVILPSKYNNDIFTTTTLTSTINKYQQQQQQQPSTILLRNELLDFINQSDINIFNSKQQQQQQYYIDTLCNLPQEQPLPITTSTPTIPPMGWNVYHGGSGGGGGTLKRGEHHHHIPSDNSYDVKQQHHQQHQQQQQFNNLINNKLIIPCTNIDITSIDYSTYDHQTNITSTTIPLSTTTSTTTITTPLITTTNTADYELNGHAIKERLMASRIPESCV